MSRTLRSILVEISKNLRRYVEQLTNVPFAFGSNLSSIVRQYLELDALSKKKTFQVKKTPKIGSYYEIDWEAWVLQKRNLFLYQNTVLKY